MKQIQLILTDAVFDELCSTLITKRMTGSFYGFADEFLLKLVEALKKDKPELRLKLPQNDNEAVGDFKP